MNSLLASLEGQGGEQQRETCLAAAEPSGCNHALIQRGQSSRCCCLLETSEHQLHLGDLPVMVGARAAFWLLFPRQHGGA